MFQNPFSLHGKTVLVTGASSGIGRAVAVECARAGACLVITGRDRPRLDETLALLAAPAEGAHQAVTADLTDAGQLAQLVAAVGQLDGVVFAAGTHGTSPVRMFRQAHLESVMATNYIAPAMLTQKLLFQKKLRNGASLVYVSSISVHTGTVGVGPYCASKAALEGFMRALALEVAPRGMRANALAPGLVDTPLVSWAEEWFAEQEKKYPLGLGKPEDVAWGAVYLLADASRKVTGIHLHLDGGIVWT
ncbi:SDR family NAD(P)-dependent oxidoreductase [uncultured Massilia sp.]|uniref:SDR family NAD(P)-dependent oxidoreductase n=1 Tax=uncultured Massilia sp. TaxID=169973 RepID=UPI00258AEE21|nr:SDR family oxidoreductase [uncultured Massilia sp.]